MPSMCFCSSFCLAAWNASTARPSANTGFCAARPVATTFHLRARITSSKLFDVLLLRAPLAV